MFDLCQLCDFRLLFTLFRIFCALEKVFRKSDLFDKISDEPKNYTIRYKYSKKDVGGGISYIQFNVLGAEVCVQRLTKTDSYGGEKVEF